MRAMRKKVKAWLQRAPVIRHWEPVITSAVQKAELSFIRLRYGKRFREYTFQRAYRGNIWAGYESHSGAGSSLEATAAIRQELPRLIESFGVTSILDIPCGDFHWMKEVPFPEGLVYTGGDILEEVIAENQARYGGPLRSFRKMNLLEDPLPRADLVLCRDCLVHFSFADIAKSIQNLKRSGSTYLLTTHFPATTTNRDGMTGQWRPLNLQAPPFHFPAPLAVISERLAIERFADKSLALFQLSDIPTPR